MLPINKIRALSGSSDTQFGWEIYNHVCYISRWEDCEGASRWKMTKILCWTRMRSIALAATVHGAPRPQFLAWMVRLGQGTIEAPRIVSPLC